MFSSNTSQVSEDANYIESCFSTHLYNGNSSTQTITNGIDLAGKGGLVWVKSRSNISSHSWFDTARGANKALWSEQTAAQYTYTDALTSFNANGFTLGANGDQNLSGATWASWTFRKQPKFFDVVTWSGNGVLSTRYISHSLGSVPGCIMVKRTDTASDWVVIHRGTSLPLILNSTAAASSTNRNNGYPDLTYTDATQFAVSDGASGVSAVNASGGTYVAYLFAHNAGGFGLTGTDNVISCGSFTPSAGSFSVNLGYEPQWLLIKSTQTADNWILLDSMRGLTAGNADDAVLFANTTSAEVAQNKVAITSTGFTQGSGFNDEPYIYIAIRRGPMKTPTTGTSVFAPVAYTGNGSADRAITTGFVPDMVWWKSRSNGTDWKDATILIGTGRTLSQNTNDAEGSVPGYNINTYNNTGFTYGISDVSYNTSGRTYVVEGFSRAPGFFDVVCYTGNSTFPRNINHNLGVAPEMVIIKARNWASGNWATHHKDLGFSTVSYLDNTLGSASQPHFLTASSASTFTVGSATSFSNYSNSSSYNYVAYLFASAPGVSKVGSYTGTGATQVINCGFTGGARFVLIKRTDSTGDWYVWDSARGIVAGNDPYLLLNSAASEVTNTDFIDTAATGFEISSTAPAAINASGGTFIFLAIA